MLDAVTVSGKSMLVYPGEDIVKLPEAEGWSTDPVPVRQIPVWYKVSQNLAVRQFAGYRFIPLILERNAFRMAAFNKKTNKPSASRMTA